MNMQPDGSEHALPESTRQAVGRFGAVFDTLFETAKDAIFVLDGQRLVTCNTATLKMFGCATRGAIVGRSPFASSPPEQPDGSSTVEAASLSIANIRRAEDR